MDGISKSAEGMVAASPAEGAKASATFCWPELLLLLASTSITVGIIWDISWHVSIGRDTFWTPAHMAIYLGGVISGCVGGWLAIKHTFLTRPADNDVSVRVFGARAPLGAWVAIWGAIAMITSAPFDNWWHNAYGLDVKIISPPHTVLGLGMLAISVAALMLAAARQNREPNGPGSGIFIYAGGIFITLGAVFITEFSYANLQHAAIFYEVCCALFPVRLALIARASRLSWPATRAAAIYLLATCLMIWILPLFPATPKLAPIFNPVTHMVPPSFPVLVVFPAFGMDLFLRFFGDQSRGWRRIPLAIALAAIFLVLLLAVHWFFAEFLLSPHADNWFFAGNRYWSYGTSPGWWHTTFWRVNPGDDDYNPLNTRAIAICLVLGAIHSWLGLAWGDWMRKEKR